MVVKIKDLECELKFVEKLSKNSKIAEYSGVVQLIN